MKNIDVTINNFGKIQHAQFPLKPFTVIAGKNSSGKSFITRALYGVFRSLNKEHFSSEMGQVLSVADDAKIDIGDDMSQLLIDSTRIELSFQAQGIEDSQQIENVVYLESPIYWKIKDVLKDWMSTQNDQSESKQRKHQQKVLKNTPEYILGIFALLNVDVIQDEVHEDLVKLKNTINKCIGGQIQISQSGDLQFYSQNKNGESFGVDLNQTASGTTSLGLISLLLEKNVIVPNSVLIMDEPEVNLHPAWQQVMIQVLYQLSVAGVRIIMASHSFDMMETIEKMMEQHEEKGLDVGEHFSVVQLDDGNTINQDKPIFKKLDAVKADLGMPLYNLFADK